MLERQKKNWLAIITFILIGLTNPISAQENSVSTGEFSALEKQINDIRIRTGASGIGVTIIQHDQPDYFHASGWANTENKTPITTSTQFRLGSISKMLVGLSILKLVEQEKLKLDQPIVDLIPEIEFDNPWHETHPIKVAHLLNHSTGWDAPHFKERVVKDEYPISVKDALEIYPESRTSRWPPGSRSAYNNTGPLVAAYIVEKITGQNYEQFVKTEIFESLGMQASDYFYSQNYRNNAATLYKGKRPLAYEHINNRASGALNSSSCDMTKFLRMLINQGQFDNRPVFSESTMDTFQTTDFTSASAQGLEVGYGMGVTQFRANGHTLYGHEGSVLGSNSILVYSPNLKAGYLITSNSEGPAVAMIHKLLADYITKDAKKDKEIASVEVTGEEIALSGFYRNITPVNEKTHFFTRLMPWKLMVSPSSTQIALMFGGEPRSLTYSRNGRFVQSETGRTALVKLQDPIAGEVLQYGPMTLKKTSALGAYLPLAIAVLWVVFTLVALVFALIWLPRKWLGKMNDEASISLRRWPLISSVCIIIVVFSLMIIRSQPDPFITLSYPSIPALIITAATSLFFICSLWSVYIWWSKAKLVSNVLVKWHASGLILFNLMIALYLLFFGVIGIRLWV